MAQSISIDSGSVLIGSPIEVSVQAESVGNKATFHRVKLIVSAALSTDGQYEDFELSAPVTDGETAIFDISDALRTVAGKFTYSPITAETTYPYLAYILKAWDEYMIDGILHEKVAERNYGSTMYALMGAFTDAERYLSNGQNYLTSFTRKPIKGEVCSQNESIVYPEDILTPLSITSVLSKGPSIMIQSLNGYVGMVLIGSHQVYVDENQSERFKFQFVNGLGVVESISAELLESVETSGTTEFNNITSSVGYLNVNRRTARKSGRIPKYRMSTGYINKEWAEWWHNEFFGSDPFRQNLQESCWMLIGGIWFPCIPVLDDDFVLYERTENGMIKIDFTVHLTIDGLVNPRM